jgi:outer membrane receptor protein involved in Fe transport
MAGEAIGQISTGGIRGFVRDESRAVLPGVTIEASSPALIGGTTSTTSDAQGLYRFENLPIGIYSVSFTMSGFRTIRREGIRVEAGRTIELEQALGIGALEETVTVTGQSPVVDATRAGTSTNFTQEALENIPTARTQYFDVVPYATGATQTSGQVGSSSAFNIFGSDSYQNAIQYDGIDVSSPNFGGSYDWPNYDMMAELQIKSVGATAEQAGFQGGVINLVLKSGSNQLRGTGSFYGQYNWLMGNNTPDEEFPRYTDYRNDVNYSVGGPLKKDRIWGLYISEHIRWQRSDSLGVPPDRPNKTRIWRPFLKVDARLTDADNISVHYNDCRDHWEYGAGLRVPPEASSVEVGYDPVITTGWTHVFGDSTLLEARAGGIFVRKDYLPVSGDYVTPGHLDLATGNVSVNRFEAAQRDNQNKMSINVKVSTLVRDFIKGTHDFKFGVQTSPWNSSTYRGAYASNMLLYDLEAEPYYALIQEPYALGGSMPTYGGFVQDDWTVHNRLTLNLGLRYDYLNASIPEVEQLDGELNPTGLTFGSVKDLITFSNFSPRLGFALKVNESGTTILKSHWGRYYGKLISGGFQSLSPGNTTSSAFFYNPTPGRYDDPYYTVDPKANFGVNPDLKNQYTDQFFVGIEQQVQSNFGINASFVYKKERDLVRMRDVGATYAPITFVDTFQGRTQELTVYDRTTPSASSLFQVTNRDDLDQDYKSVVLEANKRFSSSWQMIASYQWQRNLIYADGRLARQMFGTLNRNGFGRDPNDLINAYGRSSIDNTHGVRFTGTWQAPLGITAGFRYLFESGRPWGRIINVPLRQGVRPVLAEPRGAYFLPAGHQVGARLDKAFSLGGDRKLRFSLDLINLLNSDTPTNLRNNSSQEEFGTPLDVVFPRRGQIGIRVEF